mmetsp:Transcript_88982/g.177930  ORF Transcript_88982/g.177930 Transcript_88982/m.177930 type:complete len:265 (+) Transcript_88982:1-795(+)
MLSFSTLGFSSQPSLSQETGPPATSVAASLYERDAGYLRPNDPVRFKSFEDKWATVAYNEDGAELKRAISEFEDSDLWVRVDDVRFRRDGNASGYRNHAIADSLAVRSGAIAAYRMYLRRDGKEVAVVAKCMRGTDGHSGILHGGVTALLFDEATGWMNASARLKEAGALAAFTDPSCTAPFPVLKESSKIFGFTAYLHVNYRYPVFLAERGGAKGTVVVLRAQQAKKEGRKIVLKAAMHKQVEGKAPRLLADAEALYVLPRPA